MRPLLKLNATRRLTLRATQDAINRDRGSRGLRVKLCDHPRASTIAHNLISLSKGELTARGLPPPCLVSLKERAHQLLTCDLNISL